MVMSVQVAWDTENCHAENICIGLSPMWTLMCLFRFAELLNALSRMWHLYGLSPVWTLMWMFRSPDRLNALSHMWHLYGLSPVWTLMCLFRRLDVLNALSYMWHLYGSSPLWILLCVARSPARVNCLLQTLHSNGFSPEWILSLTASAWRLWKHLPHSVHLHMSLWVFRWYDISRRHEKQFPHCPQECISSPVCPKLQQLPVQGDRTDEHRSVNSKNRAN